LSRLEDDAVAGAGAGELRAEGHAEDGANALEEALLGRAGGALAAVDAGRDGDRRDEARLGDLVALGVDLDARERAGDGLAEHPLDRLHGEAVLAG